ncbi:MAG: hypothetical protein HOH43_07110 [Candidatus Latescibacteria bacterium]|nr:hypothetical protein [Candidatus Latescibacterota bacterium]
MSTLPIAATEESEAQAPVPMTEEQKFFFDLRGWILLPSVLDETEIEVMKAEVYAGAEKSFGGNLQKLIDHPAVVGILTEILSEPAFASDDGYSFRCENSFITVRPPGWDTGERSDNGMPHVVRPPQQANAMRYQVAGGRIFSGLTRVVWELEEVKSGQGGTTFLSGSHKAAFGYGGPDPYRPSISESPWEQNMRDTMDQYSCPPGSVVIFTESLIHAANNWTNPDSSRCAVFNCYNSIWAQWHRLNLGHELISAMPAKRQSLFRGTWALGAGGNQTYSEDNRCL